jgi:hypothetical protein
MAPLADKLGWHPDFPKAPVLSCSRLELVEEVPSPPFGMFTRLRLRRCKDPEASSAAARS